MALTVQTNTAAITALRNLNTNSANMNKSLERLSSGFRINSAADDASGFAVASKLDAQTSRLKAASLNATQALAMVKMADAGINQIQNMVGRIQSLATQAASANNAGELTKLDAERSKLESAITKIANSTNFNGTNLLSGNSTNGVAAVASQASQAAVAANAVQASQTAVSAVASRVAVAVVASNAASGAIASVASVASVASTAAVVSIASLASQAAVASTAVRSSQAAVGSVASVASVAGQASLANVASRASATAANGNASYAATASVASVAIVASHVSVAAVASNAAQAAVATVASAAATSAVLYAGAQSFQVGADNLASNQIQVNLTNDFTAAGLGLGAGDITTQANAQAYIDTAKTALDTLITNRAELGSTQNQISFIRSNLAIGIEQGTASVSSIKDADMAAEMANFTKNRILTQAGTSMLAQANQAMQNVLTLFR